MGLFAKKNARTAEAIASQKQQETVKPSAELSEQAADNALNNIEEGDKDDYVKIMEDQTSPTFDEGEEGNRQMPGKGAGPQNHLNSLFNGHLMQWKFEAEEGSAFIRVPAFYGALGLLGTSIYVLSTVAEARTPEKIVMSTCVITMALFVTILDGRFLSTNPLGLRAHIRNMVTRNFNILRFLWGRGLLYISAGVISVAQGYTLTIISGSVMILVGVIALTVGIHSSRKFAALRNSLADNTYLLSVFGSHDSRGDGYLVPHEFALLLADLGMELDDRYTLKAFNYIDTDHDRMISFEEFSHWWESGYIERGRKCRMGEFDNKDDGCAYRQMS